VSTKNFVVKNGLTTGPITLDATTGNATVTNLLVTELSDLGNVSNVTITGGNPGEVLTTDGTGLLSWLPAGGSANAYVTSPMPYYIGPTETYYVLDDRQGLFSIPITVDGHLEIDGALVQVDGFNQSPNTAASFGSTLNWNSTASLFYSAYAQSSSLTISADSGTPIDGTQARFRFKDNGTARSLTWTTGTANSFREIGTTLPNTTVINKTMYITCVYNAHDQRWDVINVVQQA
jgi:hypothetical protein